MPVVELGLRLLLATVFATAAVGKLTDRDGARQALHDFGMPEAGLSFSAFALPGLELLVAVGLLVTATVTVAELGALVLLTAFVAAIGRAMTRGEAPECHCFGQIHSEPAGWGALVRNVALGAVAVLLLVSSPGRSLSAVGAEDLALLLVSLAGLGLSATCLTLWREVRELRATPAVRRAQANTGLPRGTLAPDASLTTLDGDSVRLRELIVPGRPAALVQISPECAPCRALAPELSRWQRTFAGQLDVVAVSSGDLESNRGMAEEHGLQTLYVESQRTMGELFRVRPTPSAVLIDERGHIAAAAATGAVAIEALIRVGLGADRLGV